MRRDSVGWLLGGWLALVGAAEPAVAAWPRVCLPPVYDGGQRLHPLPTPKVFWLELLLRQHELCWRFPQRPGELRVVLAGNSSIFGFPLPVEETFGYLLNQDFARRDVPAHLFNVGFVTTYQLKDALIIHEAMRYQPDVIVYPITLADFLHFAPSVNASDQQFFGLNRDALAGLVAHPLPGLGGPLAYYGLAIASLAPAQIYFARLQESGVLLRDAVQIHARSVARHFGVSLPAEPVPTLARQTSYDCPTRRDEFAYLYRDWKTWNILAYLEDLQHTRGVEVMVVNWPVAHEPIGDCYDFRYPAADLAEYTVWLREETAARGLRYLDLLDLLPADAFLDSIHISAAGHRQIAERVGEALTPLLTEMFSRRAFNPATPAAPPGPAR